MDWDSSLLFVAFLGVLFFASAVYAFVWARRQRQFHDFDQGARAVFDDEEPEGTVTDSFPSDDPEPASSDATQPTR